MGTILLTALPIKSKFFNAAVKTPLVYNLTRALKIGSSSIRCPSHSAVSLGGVPSGLLGS